VPDDDNLQQQTFQSEPESDSGVVAAALFALASGAVMRAEEILALAREAGGIFSTDIRSTCIASLDYNPITGLLTVTFTDGDICDYHHVSMWNFLEFINAASKGGFYNSRVRGQWS